MKIERVYREILHRVLDLNSGEIIKQKKLSDACGIAISVVNYALKPLEEMNTIEKKPFGFRVINPKKILLYWASIRKLRKDIIYQTFVDKPVEDIESSLPQVVFTAYTAYKLRFKSVPSDYSEVIVYGDENVKERFVLNKGMGPNLIVLKCDEHLKKFAVTPMAQIFVDLWNLKTWYANEFVKALEGKIDGILERYSY